MTACEPESRCSQYCGCCCRDTPVSWLSDLRVRDFATECCRQLSRGVRRFGLFENVSAPFGTRSVCLCTGRLYCFTSVDSDQSVNEPFRQTAHRGTHSSTGGAPCDLGVAFYLP